MGGEVNWFNVQTILHFQALQDQAKCLQVRLEEFESERSKIGQENGSNEIRRNIFEAENVISKMSEKSVQIDRFVRIWRKYSDLKTSIQRRMDEQTSRASMAGLQRLEDDFKICSERFNRALEALDISDQEEQKSEFEQFSKKFDSFLEIQDKIGADFEKRNFENLDEIGNAINQIQFPDPEKREKFSASRDVEAEMLKIEALLGRLELAQIGLNSAKIRPEIDQLDKFAEIRQTVNSNLKKMKSLLDRLEVARQNLTKFEETLENLNQDLEKLSQNFSTEGTITQAQIRVMYFNVPNSSLLYFCLFELKIHNHKVISGFYWIST